MRGGSGNPHSWRTDVPLGLHALSLQQGTSFIPPSHHSSDGESDPGSFHAAGAHIHANPPSVPYTTGGHFRQRSNQASSGHTPDHFEDPPYVPPRLPQTISPQTFHQTEHHATHTYDRSGYHDAASQPQFPYDGGKTSPSESLHSVQSNYSTDSSSSSDYRVSRQDFYIPSHTQPPVQYTTQHSLVPRPASSQQAYQHHHYPAYQGHHRVGLEHIRYGDQPSMPSGTQFSRVLVPEFPLENYLAPEVFEDPQPRIGASSQMVHTSSAPPASSSSSMSSTYHQAGPITYSALSSTLEDSGRSAFPDAGPYLRQQLGLAPHEPVSLWSLPDPPPGEKPNQPYPMLIKLAIYGSNSKQLTLQDIYNELEKRFSWFREHRNERAWKNSIRHNLSLNKVFRHVPRPITEPGKGSYWQLDVSGGEGYKRPRKRRNRMSKTTPSDDDEDEMSEVDEETDGHSPLETRPQSSHAGSSPSSSQGIAPNPSRSVVDDANIDPELRVEGSHVVGEGRTRAGSRRHNSPYPPNPPPSRYTQSAPVAFSTPGFGAAPEIGPQVQSAQFGQSSFAQPTFAMPQRGQDVGQTVAPSLPQTRSAPIVPGAASRPGVEYTRDQGVLPTRRIRGYTVPTQSGESQGLGQSQTHSRVRSSQDSITSTGSVSSSGSSQTWGAQPSVNTKGKGRAM